MTDRPIIFSTPMIKALLAGRKTMTRRLAWVEGKPAKIRGREMTGFHRSSMWQRVEVGDRIWVREAWSHDAPDLATCKRAHEDLLGVLGGGLAYGPYYFATEVAPDTLKWRPSIYMPRWASRLTLIVTAKKIEPLQDISEDDARAEGVDPRMAGLRDDGEAIRTHRTGFVYLWGELHGTESWLNNPDVVALSFTIHASNIDDMARLPRSSKAK